MICMLCFSKEQELSSFFALFKLQSEINKLLCSKCQKDFKLLGAEERCRYCLNSVDIDREGICKLCHGWKEKYQVVLNHNAYFRYNTFAKSLIWKIKHNQDVALVQVLAYYFKIYAAKKYDLYKTVFIPYPSDSITINKRGFYLTKLILEMSGLAFVELFVVLDYAEKQHAKEFKARLQGANKKLEIDLTVKASINCAEKQYIIFDDIFTSGASIVSAYHTLHDEKIDICESVSIFR